jgi:hypothetical protein
VTALRRLLRWCLRVLRWYQRKLRRALSDVWKASYALFAVVLLNVAVPRTSQGTELLSAPAEYGAVKLLLMALALVYCTVAIWVAAATSLTNSTPALRNGVRIAGTIASTVPFWLALLVPFSAVALLTGNKAHAFGSWHADDATLLNLGALLLLLLVPFAPHSFAGTANTPSGLVRVRRTAHAVHAHLADRRLPYEIALTALGAAIFVAAAIDPVAVGRALTTWVVVYVAVAFWPLWGSRVFIAWPKLHGWPSLWALPIALALVFSNWNDNHEIDRGVVASTPTQLREFDDALADWRGRTCAMNDRCPLVIVAAEGGGLRAAYWTAAVLSELDKRSGDGFSGGVFAVSSVSGGSLGAFAYYAGRSLAAHGCAVAGDSVLAYLGDDHLAPVTSALVFGNALQWLLPWRITGFDRARAFERNMAARWHDDVEKPCDVAGNLFDQPFPRQRDGFPSLLFNATNVETGKRFIVSTIGKPTRSEDVIGRDTYWAFDPALSLGLGSIPVRTAVTLSSSFPVITPAGAAYPYDAAGHRGRLWGRIVDGGYLDGTALMTAYDIADAVRARDCSIPIAIVFISNDPSSAAGWENARDTVPPVVDPPAKLLITEDRPDAVASANPSDVPAYPPWGYEVNGIVSGGLNAHWEAAIETARRRLTAFAADARGLGDCSSLVAQASKRARPANVFCEISLGKQLSGTRDSRPALGWWLSSTSRQDMRALARCFVGARAGEPCAGADKTASHRAMQDGLQ